MTYLDEIWQALPEDRPLDGSVLGFALETVQMNEPSGAVRVLDLGCGDGRLAAKLAEHGARVTGVDPSRVALARARDSHADLELSPPAADGTLPFSDSSFDVVVCMHVLQHVADTQLVLSEVRRVLAPEGRLALAVPWHGRLKNVLVALRSFERHHDPLEPVLRFYTPSSVRDLLGAFGFDQVSTRGAGGAPLLRETLLVRARRTSFVRTG